MHDGHVVKLLLQEQSLRLKSELGGRWHLRARRQAVQTCCKINGQVVSLLNASSIVHGVRALRCGTDGCKIKG